MSLSLWHFIAALLVMAVVGVFAMLRDGARREVAFLAESNAPMPTVRQIRRWRRERLTFNPSLRRSRR